MNILVSGAAGFIGFHVAKKLLEKNFKVIGIDNLNNYYDLKLKKDRLNILNEYKKFTFYKVSLEKYDQVEKIFKKNKPSKVINLAAQAGVRYSLKNPSSYIRSNLVGFFNILDISKKYKVKNFVYASSSSVYGANKNFPFSEDKIADHPIQLYAATKRSNELIAHAYSALYNLPTIGLRFFTVYGPWGRPDQALFIFTKKILQNQKINLFNYGNHSRDFTYIDDIVQGIWLCLKSTPKPDLKWSSNNPKPNTSKFPFRIYNIGGNKKINLKTYLSLLEKNLNKKSKLNYLPLQKGDVVDVSSNIQNIKKDLGYKPSTNIKKGIKEFTDWFKFYYKIK